MRKTHYAVVTVILVVGSIAGMGAVTGQLGAGTHQQMGDGTPGTEAETQTKGPFTLTTGEVSICGLTCRKVPATLSNQANETVTNVTVESTITADGEVILQRQMEIDMLRPGESITRTVQINAGLDTLQQLRQGDGRVTVETQVTSDEYNQTFTGQRTVV